jgi:hypothetical protein
MGPARGRQLALPIHSARGARSRGGGLGHVLPSWKDPYPHCRWPEAIHPANNGSQGWRRGICHLSAGLNQVVFPVLTRVGWVSDDVSGL